LRLRKKEDTEEFIQKHLATVKYKVRSNVGNQSKSPWNGKHKVE
jgi:hypothetical protein